VRWHCCCVESGADLNRVRRFWWDSDSMELLWLKVLYSTLRRWCSTRPSLKHHMLLAPSFSRPPCPPRCMPTRRMLPLFPLYFRLHSDSQSLTRLRIHQSEPRSRSTSTRMVEILSYRRRSGADIQVVVLTKPKKRALRGEEWRGGFEAKNIEFQCVLAWSLNRLLAVVDVGTARAQMTTQRRRDV
jgi:hypothetical protein